MTPTDELQAARTLILTTGTSVINGVRRAGIELRPGSEAAQITRGWLEGLGAAANDLSAELSTLAAVDPQADDAVILLATASEGGRRAAAVVRHVIESRWGLDVGIEEIEGLSLDDAKEFRQRGLTRLLEVLDMITESVRESGGRVLLGVTGGIKAVLPYAAVYGMLRRVPVIYLFERTRSLLTLPGIPIDFDWVALGRAAEVIGRIDKNTSIPKSELQGFLGSDFEALEGLFEQVGPADVTLSPFGLMLLGDVQSSANVPVLLSSRARDAFNAAEGIERRQLERALERVRNPLWRAQKHHGHVGTDFSVWKPGRIGPRIAGWVSRGGIYIAEAFADHDTYERVLPTRRRSDYPLGEFQPAQLGTATSEPHWEEAAGQDEMLEIVHHEIDRLREELARASADRDSALDMASEAAQQVVQIESRYRDVFERAEASEALEARRRNWPFLRRLRWAFYGR